MVEPLSEVSRLHLFGTAPGSNFLSLASGGAGYLNDPYRTVGTEQLNEAAFVDFTHDDWTVILPYLEENQRLFGITIDGDLLPVDRRRRWPGEVFRKVVAPHGAPAGAAVGPSGRGTDVSPPAERHRPRRQACCHPWVVQDELKTLLAPTPQPLLLRRASRDHGHRRSRGRS